MGMFDHITCEPPLPDGREVERDSFQSKPLYCTMADFAMGRLIHHTCRYEPDEDTE
jgi:hypothetical protein